MTQFSIVVPTLNESENIDLLLSRLFALNLDPDSFEVIFVDDGSTDGTPTRYGPGKVDLMCALSSDKKNRILPHRS